MERRDKAAVDEERENDILVAVLILRKNIVTGEKGKTSEGVKKQEDSFWKPKKGGFEGKKGKGN